MSEKLTTALFLDRSRAAWTSLRERKGSVEVAEQVDAPLDVEEEVALGSPQFAAKVKARCSGVKGVVTLVLPTNQALLRVVELPSTDPDELRSMAELQVERFAPFPTDQLCIGHEVLAQTEDKSCVLVAAAPRGAVDQMSGSFSTSGVSPLRVDVEVMGWWWSLRSKGKVATSGRQLFLILTGSSTELIVSQDGLPVLIRSLATSVADAQSKAVEIAEDIDYSLTAVETEWGTGHVDRVHLWHDEKASAEVMGELAKASTILIEKHALSELLPVSEGVARRIHDSAGASLDMAPPEWKVSAISREAQKKMTMIAVSIIFAWLAALGGLYWFSNHEQMDAFYFKERIKSLDKKAGEVRELQKQVQSLQRYADRTFSPIESLREICALMPPGPELDLFTYEKFNVITMRGYSDGDSPIFEFVSQLQKSQLFPKVDPGQVSQVRVKDRQRYQFKVSIKLPEEKKPEEKKGK